VLLTNLDLNKSLNVVLEMNCFQDLGSLRGCRRSFQGDWQPASVRDHQLWWRREKYVAGCRSSVVASSASLSHKASDSSTVNRSLESNSCVEEVVIKLFLVNLRSFSFLWPGKLI